MSYITRRDYYKKGSYNAICDQSGQKAKSNNMKMQWDNLWVMADWWDPKHPQLELRPRPDNPSRSPVRNIEPGNLVLTPFTNNEII